MRLREIVTLINGKVLTGHEHIDNEVQSAFGSDLMSDVLAYVHDDTLLITGLINHQVIRTAEMLDLRAILFVRGKEPSEDVIELAKGHPITLMCTDHSLFTTAGILYNNGVKGVSLNDER